MEFRHLRYFIAVAEHLSFSKAALELHIAEPPLNRQIRQLEEELGVDLFLRERRLVDLTDAGRVLLREARGLMAQRSRALKAVDLAKNGKGGIVRLGIAVGVGETASRLLVEHLKRFPAAEVQCKDIFSTLQNDALLTRAIDVGLMRPPFDATRLNSELCYEEQLLALLSRANRFAHRKTIKLKQIADLPLVLHERRVGVGVHEKVLQLYRNAELSPHVITLAVKPDGETGLMLVASGQGVAIRMAPSWSRPTFGNHIVAIPIDEPGANIELHMVWRKEEKSVAVFSFLDSARKALKSNDWGKHSPSA